jgi:hypothetical protein
VLYSSTSLIFGECATYLTVSSLAGCHFKKNTSNEI